METTAALRNRIDLTNIPFTQRGSRILLFRRGDELHIRLAERLERWQPVYGNYRMRASLIHGFRLLDNTGNVRRIHHVESSPYLVRLVGDGGEVLVECLFVDAETLLFTLPAGTTSLTFVVEQMENATTDRRGGTLHGVRNIAYTTIARIQVNQLVALPQRGFQVQLTLEASAEQSAAFMLNITPERGANRAIPTPSTQIEYAQATWEAWFQRVPAVPQVYRSHWDYAWWILWAGLLSRKDYFTREGLTPSKIHYVGVWQWDQYFHAIAYRHVDTRLAEDQFRLIFDHQRADGMLPDAVYDEGVITHLTFPVDADVTKPPLAAWAVLKVFETSGNYDFLEEIYEVLCRNQAWWLTQTAMPEGLIAYYHPFSSGLDDSPLWDYGLPVVAPDINTYVSIQAECLAQIARQIGQQQDVAMYQAQAEGIAQAMIEMLWDERRQMYMARHNGEVVPVETPFSLLPLWTGRVPDRQRHALLNQLVDPNKFWTRFPLATVSASDLAFHERQMWRGPAWMNINYLFVEALKRIEQHDLAARLRRDTLHTVMQQRDIYEYYNPHTGERPPKAAPVFGWTSAVFVDLVMQDFQR